MAVKRATIQEDLIKVAKYSGAQFSNRLVGLMEKNRVTITDLHRNTGVPITTIQRMRADPNANPTVSSLKPIADYFDLSIDQLIGNDPIISKNKTTEVKGKQTALANVPLISWKDAITWPNTNKNNGQIFTVHTDIVVSTHSYALEIAKEMMDGFRKGAIIVIDPALKAEDTDYVVAYKDNNREATLKQLCLYEGDYYLKPLEPHFEAVPISDSYKVLGVVRQIKLDLIIRRAK